MSDSSSPENPTELRRDRIMKGLSYLDAGKNCTRGPQLLLSFKEFFGAVFYAHVDFHCIEE